MIIDHNWWKAEFDLAHTSDQKSAVCLSIHDPDGKKFAEMNIALSFDGKNINVISIKRKSYVR